MISSTEGIWASRVTISPSLFNLQATFRPFVLFVNPIKRIMVYPISSKKNSLAKEYPSITSSSYFVDLIPNRCSSGRLNKVWSYSNINYCNK